MSKADERYYKRRAAEDAARQRRREEREADMPRRLAILARVKAGEITLTEGQRMIRGKPNASDQPPLPSGKAESACSPCRCPSCGADEVDYYHPRTKYACGSTDYDQRPGTFRQSDACKANVEGNAP